MPDLVTTLIFAHFRSRQRQDGHFLTLDVGDGKAVKHGHALCGYCRLFLPLDDQTLSGYCSALYILSYVAGWTRVFSTTDRV